MLSRALSLDFPTDAEPMNTPTKTRHHRTTRGFHDEGGSVSLELAWTARAGISGEARKKMEAQANRLLEHNIDAIRIFLEDINSVAETETQ